MRKHLLNSTHSSENVWLSTFDNGEFVVLFVLSSVFMLDVLLAYSTQLHASQVAHQAGAYPSFCSMK